MNFDFQILSVWAAQRSLRVRAAAAAARLLGRSVLSVVCLPVCFDILIV